MRTDDLGKLVLRLTLGLLLIFHGIAKLKGGISGISGMVAGAGFPAALAYLVYVGEFLAPLLVIVGLFTRPAALEPAAGRAPQLSRGVTAGADAGHGSV